MARENGLLKNVYLWMTAGLTLTAVVAYAIGSNPALLSRIYSSGMYLLLVIAQLAVVFILSARLHRMSARSAVISFALYSVITGAMLSSIVAIYTGAMVSRAFFTTALMFGGMSLYAMTTKRNLSNWSSIFVMALWGMIAASILNLIFHSEGLYYIMSFIGVVLFCGITAWDTQKIISLNNSYGYNVDEETYVKLSILCALELYLDFINIFLYLIRIFGNNRRN
ncbi:MAG: Bax inhibitor-1/YccA family protein [Sphaerochaetaceae bacterium]|nr:Bax inhibitor-1/YccA family protein [Sphaerochaetaceae bacterium]